MNENQRQITKTLVALGGTADEIADTLDAGGWRGLQYDAEACPVSRYLTAVGTRIHGAAVGTYQATVHTLDGPVTEIDLPPAVAAFVQAFDRGDYPDLVVTACDDNGDPIDDIDK